MAMKTTFLVQTFSLQRKRLKPDRPETATTEWGALKKAEAMAGRLPGTAALRIVADDETGELESATILGQFGEVPDDFAESLEAA
ncbi:hypothetical protein [Methylobacterium dankookense]|uniref:Uncharacterized protein n=1 Tax=Methylobacterium dankookense TaxID=560405 RepID=A0A564FSR2_9HYPH|nr:hypothetical protein [Methylobacterium dankookense]GJD54864.1 hypothetical protein IFDJLNFL_0743 [Methylobacterium dankookense]VUF11082.1 hypothetical protein MTDSW087_00755 [Methylobacterium dankookense]